MHYKLIIFFWPALILSIALVSSCATTHPNEKLIVGNWKPTKVEPYIDESALPPAARKDSTSVSVPKTKTTDPSAKGKSPAGGDSNIAAKAEDQLKHLIQTEERTTLRINADKTAMKIYPGKTVKGTWKMKSNGMVIIAKNLETKEKIRFDIEEISDNQIVIIQNLQKGTLKITYIKEN